MRFDVPVVGLQTLKTIVEVHGKVLAVEANKSIFLNKEELIAESKKAGISIVGYSECDKKSHK
jgi:DUF1009 family protein